MFLLAYLPILLYVLLELYRSSPVKEEKQNRGSSFFIGVVFALMLTIPEIMYFFTVNKINSLLFFGVIIALIGVWIRFSSMKILGRFYSRNVGMQGGHKLIQNGLYKYVRHPGYLGSFLTFLGFAISSSSFIAVIINIILFFLVYSYRIKIEERVLITLFGEQYRQYQSKTWRIIPFLY
ncbi:isoprenylcysteine carboxylmethyltransferase family protein [Bacillus mobilis]|uniref:methyltransferase family protein n=1 Tax=Bacillus mobilis TaxID=2026190 RepID=UPI002E1A3ACE|nr:isoprenylcysteine carboxylmethyltransferase family protein [Bacillus mobilis]MED0995600.1 isoprenylcysteine carboxylmethyltransferase family protein [Bacillus mobilis]MED1003659.1 isoprenylcysteine carboxylmethyltransferase family protein [Bacillus mobilis]